MSIKFNHRNSKYFVSTKDGKQIYESAFKIDCEQFIFAMIMRHAK